ncbi:hypothetical protein [Tropicimonas sediminicola]|uniref:hypothetical protein n=1 Tax=Tropicimonas sediminicola TaxID=1031541 RepID=UPI000B780272|nr:hypothetical protein [Tropicimonas sediminicola]
MTPEFAKDMAVWIHFMGLVPGLLYALAADATAMRSLRRPLAAEELRQLRDFHLIISLALLLLWASGLALLWLKLGPGGGSLTPKLMVKLAVVCTLTANAVAIGRIGLTGLGSRPLLRFGDYPAAFRIRLGLIGGLSAACWISAFALGMFVPLASMDFGQLVLRLVPVFALCLAGGLAIAYVARGLDRRLAALREAAMPGPSDPLPSS